MDRELARVTLDWAAVLRRRRREGEVDGRRRRSGRLAKLLQRALGDASRLEPGAHIVAEGRVCQDGEALAGVDGGGLVDRHVCGG